MEPSRPILATLASLPNRKVEGKKRLQKILHLLQLAGANVDYKFRITHYGAFSSDLADSADILVLTGQLEAKLEPIGVYGRYRSVYTPSDLGKRVLKWPRKYVDILFKLDNYSTIELEVASTIGYFVSNGSSELQAIEQTKFMKPTKTIPPVSRKAKEILNIVSSAN